MHNTPATGPSHREQGEDEDDGRSADLGGLLASGWSLARLQLRGTGGSAVPREREILYARESGICSLSLTRSRDERESRDHRASLFSEL